MITRILLAAVFSVPVSAFAATSAPAVAASTSAPSNAAANAAVAAANQRFAARCAREPMAVGELMADPAFRADMEYAGEEERLDLLEFASCRALQGAAGSCAQLEGPGRPAADAAARCRSIESDARFVHQTLTGGDAMAVCRASQAAEGRRGAVYEQACSRMIALVRAEGPKLSCESLARAKLLAPGDSCDDIRAFWSSAPEECDLRLKNATDRRLCRARAALAAGIRVPAQCASSPYCQVLVTKWPGACDSLGARFARTLCSRVAKDLSAEQKRLAKEQELLNARAKEKADALAAAAAALRAKAEAALARSKTEAAAAQEMVAKKAATEAAKKAAAEAAVKAKADIEARKAAEAKARVERKGKPQFRKGEAMQKESPEVAELMKAVAEGRPIPQPKPKPKPVPADE